MFSTKIFIKILLRLAVTLCNSFEGNLQDNTEILLGMRKDIGDMKNEFQHFKRKVEEQQSKMIGILKIISLHKKLQILTLEILHTQYEMSYQIINFKYKNI